MNALTDLSPHLADYYATFLAFTVLCIAVLVQSFIAGAIGLGKSDEVPGMPLKGNHADFSFRTLRTYANSCENLPVFGFTVILAIIVGVAPVWVNWLAGIHVALRLLYWAVYYSGVGKVEGGPRTIIYAAGFFANVALALVTAWAMLG